MANMTDQQRAACLADLLREFSDQRQQQAQFRAAVDAVDAGAINKGAYWSQP